MTWFVHNLSLPHQTQDDMDPDASETSSIGVPPRDARPQVSAGSQDPSRLILNDQASQLPDDQVAQGQDRSGGQDQSGGQDPSGGQDLNGGQDLSGGQVPSSQCLSGGQGRHPRQDVEAGGPSQGQGREAHLAPHSPRAGLSGPGPAGGIQRSRRAPKASHKPSSAAGSGAVGRMLGGVQCVLLVQKWHEEVLFRVSEHAHTGHDLRLSVSALMGNLLKVDPFLSSLGKDKAALSRFMRAATSLHRAAQAERSATGAGDEEVDAAISALVHRKAANRQLSADDASKVLELADTAQPAAGGPSLAGTRVRGIFGNAGAPLRGGTVAGGAGSSPALLFGRAGDGGGRAGPGSDYGGSDGEGIGSDPVIVGLVADGGGADFPASPNLPASVLAGRRPSAALSAAGGAQQEAGRSFGRAGGGERAGRERANCRGWHVCQTPPNLSLLLYSGVAQHMVSHMSRNVSTHVAQHVDTHVSPLSGE